MIENKTRGIIADAINSEITQDLVRSLFDYRDGELYRRTSKGNSKVGNLAGSIMKNGYRRVAINYKSYYIHRVIFLYHNGYFPEFLDHIDGNRLNNDISNLRSATNQENCRNQKKHKFYCDKLSSSKYKGVCWNKRDKKWVSHIRINGRLKYLGSFDFEIEAALTYNKAATESFGEFVRLNTIIEMI